MKTLLMVQPGPFGDIFVCATIAKWYADKGYRIFWPARKEFHSILNIFDYITPIFLREDKLHDDWLRSDVMKIIPMFDLYDKVVNLSDRGPGPVRQMVGYENHEQYKFREAYVPFNQKYKLEWTRDKDKERVLYAHVNPDGVEYVFAHTGSSKGAKGIIPEEEKRLVIEAKEYSGYTIVDWYKIITKAKRVYCTESSFHAFIDGIYKDTQERYLILREQHGSGTTISEHWDKRYII